MQRSASALPVESRSTVAIWPRSISLETLLYLLILGVAIFTRFRDLSAGALHHDESMHAYYSWLYATGHGYVHNPLLHGPLLFHLTALTFLLFGESDATARLMPAIFGTVLVGLPWFLRGPRFLGRWGALSASALILISPSILYYSRHLRHDMFTLTLTMVLAIAILRYLERPERRWIFAGAASTGMMLANHEIIFAILAIFGLYLYAVFAIDRIVTWQRDPVRRRAANIVIAAHAFLLLSVAAIGVLSPKSRIDELITIPWDHPTSQQQRDYYEVVATSPVVIAFLVVAILSLVLLVAGLRAARKPELLGDTQPGSVAAGVRSLWKDHATLGIGLLVTLAIFVTLFTSLFTNLHGLVTSTIATDGTLLYWLGQHDVRRGHQPWYYFLLLTPQYELFVVVFAGMASASVVVCAIRSALGWRPADRQLFFRGFLATWFVGLFVALSIAGEKMPWLIVHYTLPGLLLAGLVIGRFIERVIASSQRSGTKVTGLSKTTSLRDYGDMRRLQAPALVNGVMVLLIAVLALFQIHTAWRMTYLEGDIPRDMLIYTQTAPDVPMLVSDLKQLSYESDGDMSLNVYFGGEATWPFWWYLRDFPNRHPAGTPETSALVPANADVYIVNAADLSNPDAVNHIDSIFAGYTRQVYVLRWAYPESGYRHFAIAPEMDPSWSVWGSADRPHGPVAILGSILDSIESAFTRDERHELYRLMVYRDVETPFTSWDARFFIYVRDDLLPAFNEIRY
jgi:uncharacterized protein (TIGR03663 family)